MEYEVINTDNINEARKLIDKANKENKNIIIIAKDDSFNRKIFENKKVDVIFGLELERKDKLKQRDSGLNQVLCKLAKQNDISIGINFPSIQKLSDFHLSKYLGRLSQNIMLCKKYKVSMVLVNTKENKQDLSALLLSLGMSTNMAKYTVENTITFNNK